MPYYDSGLKLAVDGIATGASYIAFHTADPAGTAGASQTGDRVQTTWGTTTNGVRTGSQVSASIGAGVTVTHWSINTTLTGTSAGTMVYSAALATAETFGSAGTLQHTPTLTVSN